MFNAGHMRRRLSALGRKPLPGTGSKIVSGIALGTISARATSALLILSLLAGPVEAKGTRSAPREHRSQAVLHAFQKAHPCPSTGKTTGPCPGYVKDHIKPLACGGPDAVENLQWQTVEDGKAKDKVERIGC